MFAVRQSAGNRALGALVRDPSAPLLRRPAPATARAPTATVDPPAPRLRTALDSQLHVVAAPGGGYTVLLRISSASDHASEHQVATYASTGAAAPAGTALPILLQDFVQGGRAVVDIRYDPSQVHVEPAFTDHDLNGTHVSVRVHTARSEELAVAKAPEATRVRQGMVVEGTENVTSHEGSSATDKIMGSIASAEGGFASTEMSDAGVLTWGQGQWTVTAGELQKVLAFIKTRRRDLFDRYWGSAGLDVDGDVFVFDGRRWAKDKTSMMQLFRPDLDRIAAWAALFSQAGMDPQLQRLEREYLRGEVEDVLAKRMGGRTPEETLDTRGQAYFYSMDKNLPGAAKANFEAALRQVPVAAPDTDALKATRSDALGELFRNSSVVAFSNDKVQIIAFWGEGGRRRALELADAKIAAGGGNGMSVAAWQRYRRRMDARESRYHKTRADIDRALARTDIEPDVPAGAFDESAAAPPATAPAASPPPATAHAGASAAPEEPGLLEEGIAVADLVATGLGLERLELRGSVGRNGDNMPIDVVHVRARLFGLGYVRDESSDLVAAIERYQREVVGSPHPDGRIDPHGPTIRSLNAPAGHGAPAAPPASARAPASPSPDVHPPAAPATATPAPPAHAAPTTPQAPPAAQTVAPLPSAPLTGDAAAVVAPFMANAAVAGVAAELGALQHLAPTIAKQLGAEEIGDKRRQLVDGIKSVRTRIAALDHAGLDPQQLAHVKSALYRAIDDISPYYFQVTNVDILEAPPPDQTRTCNITSVSMALEALGKTPGDYKGDKQVIEAIAKVYESKLADAQKRSGDDLTKLRLPDYIELVAIAQCLGKKPSEPAEIQKAAEDAWKKILMVWFLVEIAKTFGVPAHHQYFNMQGGARGASDESSTLKKYGGQHRALTEQQVDVREFERRLETATGSEKKDLEARLEKAKQKADAAEKKLDAKVGAGKAMSEADMEGSLPLAQYKDAIVAGIQPQLDAGNQVVVSLSEHYTRLQAIHDEFLVIDDPGQWTRSNRHVTWNEARAMGYFWIWIVLGS
jgi:hypothetical protein